MIIIKGKLKGGETEEIDEFETEEEALKMLEEYVLAFGSGWHLWLSEKYD